MYFKEDMTMRNKKYLAALLAGTMVIGSSVTAFASGSTTTPSYVSSSDVTISDSNVTTGTNASGNISGGGQLEGNVSEDVFTVVVPECITSGGTFNGFDFVMDPQMLITKTQASKYVSASTPTVDSFVADKTLYFYNKSNRVMDDTSDLIKVTNKSSMDVEISLDAEVPALTTISMSDTSTFADDDSASLYLALKDADGETAITEQEDGTNKGSLTKTIAKAPDGSYEVKEANGSYEYVLKDSATGFADYEFALTGACNAKGDWSAVSENPQINLTWEIKPAFAKGPSIATKTYKMTTGKPVEVTVDLGTGNLAATSIASITYSTNANPTNTLAADNYTFANGKLTIKADYVTTLCGLSNFTTRDYKITFNDTAKTEVTITLNK